MDNIRCDKCGKFCKDIHEDKEGNGICTDCYSSGIEYTISQMED